MAFQLRYQMSGFREAYSVRSFGIEDCDGSINSNSWSMYNTITNSEARQTRVFDFENTEMALYVET
jgi:hypothetical protein